MTQTTPEADAALSEAGPAQFAAVIETAPAAENPRLPLLPRWHVGLRVPRWRYGAKEARSAPRPLPPFRRDDFLPAVNPAQTEDSFDDEAVMHVRARAPAVGEDGGVGASSVLQRISQDGQVFKVSFVGNDPCDPDHGPALVDPDSGRQDQRPEDISVEAADEVRLSLALAVSRPLFRRAACCGGTRQVIR